MKNVVRTVVAVVVFTGVAQAQPVTIETTLGEHGFPDGVVLRGQATSSIFIGLPRGTPVTNGRLVINAEASTPTLQRGSFGVEVNGQPVDAIGLSEKSGSTPFQRTISLHDDRLNGVDGLNILLNADLRTDADPCQDDVDPANSVTVAPTSRIAFDVDVGRLNSVADALALLPQRPLVMLPAQSKVSPEIAAVALQVGIFLTGQGREPRFETARGTDGVAIRIGPAQEGAATSPSIRIERQGSKVDIVVDPGADFVALSRMLQAAPAALVGEKAVVSQGPVQPQTAGDNFRAFPVLPSVQRIKRNSDWRLNFPLVAGNGRLAESALLKVFMVPDWSGERPIMTMYLNDQIVGAARPDPGKNDISVELPASLLRFSNTLRVNIERAPGDNYCAATDQRRGAQIMPGSGLILGSGMGAGFVRVANAFAVEGQVGFPESAADANAIGPYLRLTSKILASFGAQARKVVVSFGEQSLLGAPGTIRFEVVGPGGLVLTMADQIEARDLRYEVSSPLALLSVEDSGRTLLVQLSDAQDIPQPKSLYLGGGSKALVADGGVVWQNSAAHEGASVGDQALSIWKDIFSKTGIAVWLVSLLVIILFVGSRAVIKARSDRLRRNAGK